MNFALFLLLNAVLLVRPEELFPAVAGLRLYLLAVVGCVLTSLPGLQRQLSVAALRDRPVSVCVLLFYFSTLASLCAHGRAEQALTEFGPEFAKAVLYYFLLLAVVDTRDRFRAYVAALVLLIAVLTGVGLASFYGYVDFPNIVPAVQGEVDPATGETYLLYRLTSSGIFSDPNDLCLIFGLGILCCVYLAMTTPAGAAARVFWLAPIVIYVYGFLETHSRGGMLSVLAGLAAYLYSRYGGPRALPLIVAGAVAALVVVGGRAASIGGGGTAHQRLMFWAEGFAYLGQHPTYIFTGAGMGWFQDETEHVAHNSFVQAYVEFGVFGGGAFLGAFYFAARLTDRLGRGLRAPRWVVEARHFGFAVVIGYAMGCYSLTRNFVIPTYMALGIAGVLLDRAAWSLPDRFRVNGRWFVRFVLQSALGLALLKYMTQGLGKAGV